MNKIDSKKKSTKDNEKLDYWKKIVSADETAYTAEFMRMQERESIYRGQHELREIYVGDETKKTPHCRNIVAELIESQINSNIPQPKVNALRQKDEQLAKLIEDMIRNMLNKLPSESNNDQLERTVPIQGGAYQMLEWDNSRRTHTTVGECVLSYRHPKQIIPQEGITSDVEDMDHITITMPQTKTHIERVYGVSISQAAEERPEARSADGNYDSVPDMLTQYIVISRNNNGGFDQFSLVCDVVLEDIEDYQARHLRRCEKCGAQEGMFEVDEIPPTLDGTYPIPNGHEEDSVIKKHVPGSSDQCPHCGGKLKDSAEEFEILDTDIELTDGRILTAGMKIPYYKPDIYPVFLQRNVSSFGKLLGESDVDKIEDQQNTINRLWAKIIDMLIAGGSYLKLPNKADIKKSTGELQVIRFDNIADLNGIGTIDVTPNINPALTMIEQAYKEAQQIIGVTDSFLGRNDPTATSGKAKEFSAAQAAGRMDSKRVMKNACYARIFEAIFKFVLAYAAEPRPIIGIDNRGYHRDEEWNKWLFLEIDDAGQPYWNTDFLFDTDSTAPLAQNREAMWQETRSHFEGGAFGDPALIETRMYYWEQMALLHYPGASRNRDLLREQKQKEDEMKLKQAEAQKEALAKARTQTANMQTQLQEQTQTPIVPEVNPTEYQQTGGNLI